MGFEKESLLVQQWLDETDAIAMQHFRIDTLAEIKDDGTPVTAGDREVERALRRHLEESFPHDAILGEEEGAVGEASRMWIIDPIDGTKNYARGVAIFATLVALAVDGDPVFGFVSAPALATRWWAARGEGAYCNGAPINVSGVADIEQAHVCTGGPDWAHKAGRGDALATLETRVARVRGFGDFWGHMLVAQGSMEAMIEFAPLAVWDIAAPRVVVEEAGGKMTTLDGTATLDPGPRLSTNGTLHDEFLEALKA